MMIGLSIGIIAGAFQFWLLLKFSRGIVSGVVNIKYILLGFAQFFLPLGVLVSISLLRRQELLFSGAGIAGTLIACAFLKYLAEVRNYCGRGDNND